MSEYAGGQYADGPTWAADPLAAYHEAADWRIRDAAIRDRLADELECETPADPLWAEPLVGPTEEDPLWDTSPDELDDDADPEQPEVSPAGIALGRYVVGPMIAGAAFGLGLIGIYGLIDLVHAWLG